MEIVYLFWAIAAGIVVGAGMIVLAVVGSAIVGVTLILFANRDIHDIPYILIVNCTDEEAELAAIDLADEAAKRLRIKSKTVSKAGIEWTAELRLKGKGAGFVNRLNELDGVSGATLVSYNGDYMA